MNLKPTALALIAALSSPVTFSSGIPVVDVASITQMVLDSTTRAAEFAETITEARNRLNQLKNQADHYKAMVEGHYHFEEIISDRELNRLFDLSDYRDVYGAIDDIGDLREEYGLYSNDPATQRSYDMQLKQLRLQETLYQQSTERQQRMSALLNQFGQADTPAAKDDLANSIHFEKMQMENEQTMMTAMTNMLEKQKRLEAKQQAQAFSNSMFGDGIPFE
ncbi:type IV secretion system protein [Vibrio mediterranei]|uniref:Conjugal transfer protein TrbJ n=1 Tax=Vibrio mediterranei TaxID=689 RepID=A0ABX5DBW5_9VIBR|nr:type IV secretion system protein [Vibrio mediterranei]PCD85639.1 conjugal transfer protein TrbJ [Vibrio mediterranei]PRQ66518.1 conjugal transfer protein TrbJ [Vibrio mediterranei]